MRKYVLMLLAGLLLSGCYLYKISGEVIPPEAQAWVLQSDHEMFIRVNREGNRGDFISIREDREQACYLVQAGMKGLKVRVLPLSENVYALQYDLGPSEGYGLDLVAKVEDGVYAMAPNSEGAFHKALVSHGLDLSSGEAVRAYDGDLLATLKAALLDYSRQMRGQEIELFALSFSKYNSKRPEELAVLVKGHATWPGSQ